MNDKQIRDLISENNLLKRELSSLKVRLEKMQKSFMKQHEEIHELRIKNGARHIGPYKQGVVTLDVKRVDKSNNI